MVTDFSAPSMVTDFSAPSMVTDFSAGAIPIGMKSCTALRPYLRQVFGVDSFRDGRVLGVNRGRMAGYASC